MDAKSCQRKKHENMYIEKIIFVIFKLNICILDTRERAHNILFQTTDTFLVKYYTSSKMDQQDVFSCVFIQDLTFAKEVSWEARARAHARTHARTRARAHTYNETQDQCLRENSYITISRLL